MKGGFIAALITVAAAPLFRVSAESGPLISPDKVLAQLDKIREKTAEQDRLLEVSRRRSMQLTRATERITSELDAIRSRIHRTTQEVSNNASLRAQLETKLDRTRTDIAGLQEQLSARVRAYYLHTRLGTRSLLRKTGDPQSEGNVKAAFFLAKVQAHDQAMVVALEEAEKELDRDLTALGSLTAESKSLQLALAKDERALREKLAAHRALLQEAVRREKRLAAAVRALTGEADRLEEVIAKITGADEPKVEIASASTGDEVRGRLHEGYFEGDREEDTFQGNGLPPFFSPPVSGPLVSRFGARALPGTGDTLRQRGVEIGINVNGQKAVEVRSVAPGVVRFHGTLPRYGRVIIVDHGQRDFTLYGRVGEPLVQLGALVDTRELLARIATPKDENSRLASNASMYFEVRRRGIAEDPVPYVIEWVDTP